MAFREAERIGRRVVDAVLDPAVPPATAAKLGLELIGSIDPAVVATVSTPLPSDPDGVSKLSLSQLMELGQSMGFDPSAEGRPLPAHNGSIEPLSSERE